ncbi:hypothetical protein GUJ93_ZPchr0003g17132 [Zizania palustris]|uniref:Uncharacterized protein n=1 Tax=Zizania palustris TaxID=103762 RepID=A0A8J5SBY1_ZIZPA|nr:hypothetical protein GUJ93_ZPchr0003g17132 [Zizania palustris]
MEGFSPCPAGAAGVQGVVGPTGASSRAASLSPPCMDRTGSADGFPFCALHVRVYCVGHALKSASLISLCYTIGHWASPRGIKSEGDDQSTGNPRNLLISVTTGFASPGSYGWRAVRSIASTASRSVCGRAQKRCFLSASSSANSLW